MRVAECSGYSALCMAIERNQILIFNWLYDTAAERKRLPANHHAILAGELCSQNIERADAAMRSHVMYGRDEVLQTLETLYPRDRLGVGL
jgi:DNA-binding GntR family transcriptional regulator